MEQMFSAVDMTDTSLNARQMFCPLCLFTADKYLD